MSAELFSDTEVQFCCDPSIFDETFNTLCFLVDKVSMNPESFLLPVFIVCRT